LQKELFVQLPSLLLSPLMKMEDRLLFQEYIQNQKKRRCFMKMRLLGQNTEMSEESNLVKWQLHSGLIILVIDQTFRGCSKSPGHIEFRRWLAFRSRRKNCIRSTTKNFVA